MAEKQQKTTNANGREREHAAIVALAQAVRLTTAALRSIHPSSLVDELEVPVERHLRAAEQAVAWAE